jgi:hypothetical protein
MHPWRHSLHTCNSRLSFCARRFAVIILIYKSQPDESIIVGGVESILGLMGSQTKNLEQRRRFHWPDLVVSRV